MHDPSDQAERSQGASIDFICANCGCVFEQYQGRCPRCGMLIDELFSGRYHPRRGRAMRLAAWIVILGFAVTVAAAALLIIRAILVG